MFTVIRCTQCDNSSDLDCFLSFVYENKWCSHCHKTEHKEWRWYFCNTMCLLNWMNINEVGVLGFPCKHCMNSTGESTGHLCGILTNDRCHICNGAKRLLRKKGVTK